MSDDHLNGEDLITDYSAIYFSSKNTSWKKIINDKYTVIFDFLIKRELLLIDVFDENGEIKKDLILRRKHLTPVGAKMFKEAIPKWQKARDRDQNLKNIGLLEKGYEKLVKSDVG